MEEGSANEEEVVRNRKRFSIDGVIKYAALFLAPSAAVFLTVYIFLYDRQRDKREEEEAKLNSQPQLEAELNGEVPIGIENYLRIKLENRNENIITSGNFSVQFTVCLETETGLKEKLVWENVFMETEIEYDDDLQGCFLFIKADFSEHEEQIMEACADEKIEVMKCNSYAFCCFQYIEAGLEETVYYLISLEPYKKSKVTVVEDPDEYMNGFLMDS